MWSFLSCGANVFGAERGGSGGGGEGGVGSRAEVSDVHWSLQFWLYFERYG